MYFGIIPFLISFKINYFSISFLTFNFKNGFRSLLDFRYEKYNYILIHILWNFNFQFKYSKNENKYKF
jgi:hypothetical protein